MARCAHRATLRTLRPRALPGAGARSPRSRPWHSGVALLASRARRARRAWGCFASRFEVRSRGGEPQRRGAVGRDRRTRALRPPLPRTARRGVPRQRGVANSMQITKNSLETAPGPSDWFTGAVYLDTVAIPSEPSRLAASSVHFTPGARTAWHTHPFGQTNYVTEGVGLCQRRGGPIEVIRSGDRVFFEPGEDHWHGAAPNRFMTQLAMQEVDDQGSPVTWGGHVTDEEYGAAPSIDQ